MEPEIDYARVVDQMLARLKENNGITYKTVPSTTPQGSYGHGPAGLFSAPGLSQPLFSAMTLPIMGVQSMLPAYPSRDAYPLYGIVTGVTATSGNEPTNPCDDPPTIGLTKLCTQTAVFGRQSRQTPVVEVDRAGLWTNRGEFGDLRMMNNPFVNGTAVGGPTMPGMNVAQLAQNEFAKKMFEFAVGWSRDFANILYSGNPANNTAGGGYKEFYGLDVLINTGYKDAETNVVCPAADSIVRSFGSLDIATNGGTLVRTVTNIFRNLKYIAQKTGLAPVTWVIAMPWSLFYEVTEVWPCAYLSYRCQNLPTGSTNFIDAAQQVAMRDDMRGNIFDRTGQYLLIDGQRVPVVLDDAIVETVLPGESFTAPMYFIPLTVVGGTQVTYLEYFDQAYSYEIGQAFSPGFYQVTDAGRFLIHRKPPTNFCVQMLAKTEPRLVLRTPFIAARLTNIKYTPIKHERGWDPYSQHANSSFYVDGGKTNRGGSFTSFFTPT